MRLLRFHWHRLNEWLDDLGAARAFARVRRDNALGRHLFERARRHGAAADAICPPAGPGGEPPAEAAPPEYERRRQDRHPGSPKSELRSQP